jgi:hypothetical protein
VVIIAHSLGIRSKKEQKKEFKKELKKRRKKKKQRGKRKQTVNHSCKEKRNKIDNKK